MESPRIFPAVPRSVEEHDVLRSSIAQAQTEKQHTAKRLANLERAVKAMAELIQVMAAANAEDRLARLENRMDHVWANVEV